MRIFTLCSDTDTLGVTAQQAMWNGYPAGQAGLSFVDDDLQYFQSTVIGSRAIMKSMSAQPVGIDEQIDWHLDQLNALQKLKKQ